MPRKPLTVAYVERIKPPASGQVEHFDLGFPGLALRVSYAGAKSWRFSYRVGGIPRRMCLGPYPAVSLLEARDAWRTARIAVSKGIDPAARETVHRTDAFSVAVAEWIKRDKADCKASTINALERVVAFDLLPAWGSKRVDTITKRDVLELLDGIADRGAPQQARNLFVHLNAFFKWCHGREIVIANPMTGLKRPGAESERDECCPTPKW
jgi:Arm DNA-binding domain